MATPIDFSDLERRGVLEWASFEGGYKLLKPASVPAHAWQQAG
jgi:hypothetical protein